MKEEHYYEAQKDGPKLSFVIASSSNKAILVTHRSRVISKEWRLVIG